jgi:hypothetical protein
MKFSNCNDEIAPEVEYLTPAAAARFIGKSEGSVRGYAQNGKLPCIRTSTGLRLFRRADLEKFISDTNGREAIE